MDGSEDQPIRYIQASEAAEKAAPVIASEMEQMAVTSIPYDEDPFLDCDDLEENDAVTQDDD